MKSEAQKNSIYKKYPVTKTKGMVIRVFDPTASEVELTTCEDIIKTFYPDYTYEMLDEHHAQTEYEGEDLNPPLFKMALEYTLDENGLSHVKIEQIRGNLTDHYDPKSKVIRLSEPVYDSNSVAALGVAAHEAGHAIQYAKGYAPIKLRAGLVSITNFSSMLAIPLFFIGLLMASEPLMLAGIILYAAISFFQLVTLPVEFNASSRALAVLSSSGMLNPDELKGAKQVLTAAALTYVAALLTSLLTLLRLILLAGGRGDRRR
jgi:Zn-dependent membrane protease YugP